MNPIRALHPVYRMRQHAVGRFILRQFDLEVCLRCKRLAFPIYGRRIQHFRMVRDYEPTVGAAFVNIMREHEIRSFWDVGANIGFYSFLVKTKCPKAIVEAFEPDPRNSGLMRRTIERSRIEGVTVHDLALGDSVDTTEFSFDDVSGLAGCVSKSDEHCLARTRYGCTRKATVETSTIDAIRSLSECPVSLVKVDVEGHEACVVKGALQTIASDKPVVLIECLTETYPEVERLFRCVAYSMKRIDGFNFLATSSGHL